MKILFDSSAFRAHYPDFASPSIYSDNLLSQYFDTATAYISDTAGYCFGGGMTVKQRKLSLNLMTAHLLTLTKLIAQGNVPGLVQAATVDKVNVTLTPPPVKSQFQYWLSQTGYGQQLLALLQIASVGGFYASTAVPGRAGFWFGNGQ